MLHMRTVHQRVHAACFEGLAPSVWRAGLVQPPPSPANSPSCVVNVLFGELTPLLSAPSLDPSVWQVKAELLDAFSNPLPRLPDKVKKTALLVIDVQVRVIGGRGGGGGGGGAGPCDRWEEMCVVLTAAVQVRVTEEGRWHFGG